MILDESDNCSTRQFDIAIVAVGYESRCVFVSKVAQVSADRFLGLEFGFLQEGAYDLNKEYFTERDAKFMLGIDDASKARNGIKQFVLSVISDKPEINILVDISTMTRQMMSNIALALNEVSEITLVHITVAYAPSKYHKEASIAAIGYQGPINMGLAGWSSRPEIPLGAIFGMGCEENLVLGALQFLEPDKGWLFLPKGIEAEYDEACKKSNEHISDIFDVTYFQYNLLNPTVTRLKYESLLLSLSGHYRLITVPLGPKIFSWLSMATVIFGNYKDVGLWTFSSRDKARPIDRQAEGTVIWYRLTIGNGSL